MKNTDHLNSKIFLDEKGEQAVARYETVKYPRAEKLLEAQISQFWVPREIDVTKDRSDFKSLSEADEHIFISNLLRQIILDTKQGKAPAEMFLPIVTNPECEGFIELWSAFEHIHNRSYTHIIRNVFPNPSEIFDQALTIPEISNCSDSISKYYDELDIYNARYKLEGKSPAGHKEAIWRALVAVNALEGIRFYLSFACSWNFAELKKMMGNANIIRLIARDEVLHLTFTQWLLNTLPKDDPDFAQIKGDLRKDSTDIFMECQQEELDWAKYLFKYGGMIGMNEGIACDYVNWLTNHRAKVIGIELPDKGKITTNPLPWTNFWIGSKSNQNANQENENTQYVVGGLKPDMDTIDAKSHYDLKNLLAGV